MMSSCRRRSPPMEARECNTNRPKDLLLDMLEWVDR